MLKARLSVKKRHQEVVFASFTLQVRPPRFADGERWLSR
jgi:hypothetical protein